MDKSATAEASPSAPEERPSCLQQTTLERAMGLLLYEKEEPVIPPVLALFLHQKCRATAIPPVSFILAVSLTLPVLLQLPTPCLRMQVSARIQVSQQFAGNAHGGLLALACFPVEGAVLLEYSPCLRPERDSARLWTRGEQEGAGQTWLSCCIPPRAKGLLSPSVQQKMYGSTLNAPSSVTWIYSFNVIHRHIRYPYCAIFPSPPWRAALPAVSYKKKKTSSADGEREVTFSFQGMISLKLGSATMN